MKVCIDSCVYIEMAHGKKSVADFLASCEEIIVPAATFAELTEGILCDDKAAAKIAELNTFLDKGNVRFVPAGHAIAFRYAEIAKSLRRRKTPIPKNCIWIAATAFETSSCVLSYDNHFDLIDGLGRIAP
ncbi:MAG: PIN domain-containing protein [Kiritimatiellae bacterium]|nr:PIN domain-containing protein [Kiritimatiellia bacterium]